MAYLAAKTKSCEAVVQRLDPKRPLGLFLGGDVLFGSPAAEGALAMLVPERHDFWLLPRSASVALNGWPAIGPRRLREGDHLTCFSGSAVFSGFSPLEVVGALPLEYVGRPCRTCRGVISAPLVRCPGCGGLFHENPDYPCFSVRGACLICGFPAEVGGTEDEIAQALLEAINGHRP